MATRYEIAKDELVATVKEHEGMLRVLGQRTDRILEKKALLGVADAYKRYAEAWDENQRMQRQVR